LTYIFSKMSLQLLSEEGYRIDGRKPNELRKIRCNMGVFKQADGSAYIEQGNTKILASVYGPHEPSRNFRNELSQTKSLINVEYSQAPFCSVERKHRPRGDRRGLDMSHHIKECFEASIITTVYPKTQIDICLHVIQSDGSEFAVGVNAATLALIDAGIPMKDYTIACSASPSKEEILTDVNNIEESVGRGQFSAAIHPVTNTIVFLQDDGKLHENHFGVLLDAVQNGCQDIFAVLKKTVREAKGSLANNMHKS